MAYYISLCVADALGQGSTQASGEASSSGKDQPFWDSLNANVKNLHAVISGHGECDVNRRSMHKAILPSGLC